MAKKPGYKIDQLSLVKEQVRALDAKAAARGIRREYHQALHAIFQLLESRPTEWGDPEWSTHKEGGVVCHGIVEPLIVQYVVYQQERAVCILKINPLPNSPLA